MLQLGLGLGLGTGNRYFINRTPIYISDSYLYYIREMHTAMAL